MSAGVIAVRPARLDDLDAVRALVSAMGGHEQAARGPGLGTAFAQALASAEGRVLVAEVGSVLVGYLELQARASVARGEREGWIGGLAVARGHRGAGIGTSLLAEARRVAAMLGCETLTVESSEWRDSAHRFYLSHGFAEPEPPARRFRLPLAPPASDDVIERFLHAAALACVAAGAAIVGLHRASACGSGADGKPTEAADAAAEEAALARLAPLDLPICSEEGGLLRPPAGAGDEGLDAVDASGPGLASLDGLWISLDPLDGSRNYRAGHPPWATAIGLVRGGRAVAGYVLDHTSGRRWWAATGRGAFVDGTPARPRAGGLVATPSQAPTDGSLPVLDGYERCRMSGATAVDLCRVADGSLGAFIDFDRGVVHMHDLAGPLAVLDEAGACVLDLNARPPLLEPDPACRLTLAAAATRPHALALLRR